MAKIAGPNEPPSLARLRTFNLQSTGDLYSVATHNLGPDYSINSTGNIIGFVGRPENSADVAPGRISFRLSANGADAGRLESVLVDTAWKVDVTANGMDATTKTGGKVPGQTLGGLVDYLVWALIDWFRPRDEWFRGYIITRKPITTYGSTGGSLLPGGVGTFNVTVAPNTSGLNFPVSARVLVRGGTGFGSAFNLGTIIAVVAGTITIQLDNNPDYSATVPGSGTIMQLNRFAPLDHATGLPYLGLDYCYVGNLQTQPGGGQSRFRLRGDYYYLPAHIELYNALHNSVVGFKLPMALAMGAGITEVSLWIILNRDSGNPVFGLQFGLGISQPITSVGMLNGASHPTIQVPIKIPIRSRDSSIWLTTNYAGAGDVTVIVRLLGWREDRF